MKKNKFLNRKETQFSQSYLLFPVVSQHMDLWKTHSCVKGAKRSQLRIQGFTECRNIIVFDTILKIESHKITFLWL